MIMKPDGKEYFVCHGNCGKQGDAVDLVGYLRIPGYNDKNPGHIQQALRLVNERYVFDMPEKKWYDDKPKLIGTEWKQYVPAGEAVREYAKKRGLLETTLNHFQIGQDGNLMVIPAFEDHRFMGIKYRNIKAIGTDLRYWSMKGSRIALFNYDDIAYTTEPVGILKGEIAVMALWQLGVKVCAPTAGEERNRDKWLTALALSKRRVVIGDNDKTGIAAGKIRAAYYHAKLVFPPKEFKDIDQWLLEQPGKAVPQILQWLK